MARLTLHLIGAILPTDNVETVSRPERCKTVLLNGLRFVAVWVMVGKHGSRQDCPSCILFPLL
ncbi:hypothetical protein AD949_10770 [Acetobacter orleanensis]|nr:hypothetical protein AD949_10770 [Acetobacter orleanensis]PCD79972.1 hypothetical protein CO710_03695 [Acetobacter orleanensis]